MDGLRIPCSGFIDLERSCFCGQAFRWRFDGEFYSCVIGGKNYNITVDGGCISAHGADESDREKLSYYFDTLRDYDAIERRMAEDPVLARCIPYAKGIRVFRQEPFETLISFIISANNNIKRITGTVEKLCALAGERLPGGEFAFPAAEAVCALSEAQLTGIGTGYRAPYIIRTARAVADGFDLAGLADIEYGEARKRLCSLAGVGPKVADCVLLFSLGHTGAFPMDVWMKRAVSEMFFDGDTPTAAQLKSLTDKLGGDAGIIQQYIFHYARQTGMGAGKAKEA